MGTRRPRRKRDTAPHQFTADQTNVVSRPTTSVRVRVGTFQIADVHWSLRGAVGSAAPCGATQYRPFNIFFS